MRGEGDAGRKGGEMGDLYVFIKVRSHPSLKREGVGIHSTIDVSYVDAILGTNVKVRPGLLQDTAWQGWAVCGGCSGRLQWSVLVAANAVHTPPHILCQWLPLGTWSRWASAGRVLHRDAA